MHQKVIWVRVAGESIVSILMRFSIAISLLALPIIENDYFVNAEHSECTSNLTGQKGFQFRCEGTG